MRYRRANAAGGTYFSTVNLVNRNGDLLVRHIDKLREAFRTVRRRHHFDIVAMVVLPDHLHAVWRLPPNDTGFPMRWSLIKAGFSRGIPRQERIRKSREKKRERGIWQRRYWEHRIRDEIDLERHVAYIHFNPVKHGYTLRTADWPYSSIHRYIEKGWLTAEWGAAGMVEDGNFGEM